MHPVENIRALVKEAAYPPFEAPAKVFIIHDAHQMLPASSNALLKTLEEPTAHTFFILITSQAESLLPTIVSRSRPVPFFPIPDKEIEHFAQEHWHKDQKEARRIAFLSHGSFAKARQLVNAPKDEIRALVYALLDLSLPEEYARLLSLCEELETLLTPDEGAGEESASAQIDDLLEEIFAWYRDLHLLKSSIAPEYLFHLDAIEQLRRAAVRTAPPLEEVLKRLLILRASLQRHVKLRVALEHFFN
jgi:DNA polymerase-3 subunit delta'